MATNRKLGGGFGANGSLPAGRCYGDRIVDAHSVNHAHEHGHIDNGTAFCCEGGHSRVSNDLPRSTRPRGRGAGVVVLLFSAITATAMAAIPGSVVTGTVIMTSTAAATVPVSDTDHTQVATKEASGSSLDNENTTVATKTIALDNSNSISNATVDSDTNTADSSPISVTANSGARTATVDTSAVKPEAAVQADNNAPNQTNSTGVMDKTGGPEGTEGTMHSGRTRSSVVEDAGGGAKRATVTTPNAQGDHSTMKRKPKQATIKKKGNGSAGDLFASTINTMELFHVEETFVQTINVGSI